MGSRNPSSIPLRNMPLETQIIIVEKIDFLTPKQTVCCSLSHLEREREREGKRERERARERASEREQEREREREKERDRAAFCGYGRAHKGWTGKRGNLS